MSWFPWMRPVRDPLRGHERPVVIPERMRAGAKAEPEEVEEEEEGQGQEEEGVEKEDDAD